MVNGRLEALPCELSRIVSVRHIKKMTRVIAILCIASVCIGLAECDVTKDACVWETFQASCSGNQVIVVEKALFGRLISSRCFNLTLEERPCYADVLSFAERRCSGRRECKIKLTNENLKLFPSNCSVYIPKSLQITYKCIAAYSSENGVCALNQSLFVTSRSGYLANIITDETGQGSELCPWRFDLPPGHTVRLTLLDFGVWIDRVNRDKRNICRIYATIEEMGDTQRRRKTIVCGGMERRKFIMSTDRNITITLMKQDNTVNDITYFFIKYQVFNCPEFEIPAGFVADITEDGIVIFCQISPHQFWEMKCISGEWVPKLNITCLAGPSTLQPLPKEVTEKQQITEAAQLCPEILSSNEASFEITERGYRVSCPEGDSVELLCRDGTWLPTQPSKCTAYVLYPGNNVKVESRLSKEACVWERLQAYCSGNKVLLIEKASFGRLPSSRCFNLTTDERPCYADVRSFVERHCSGRRYCEIRLTNENLKLFPSNCSVYMQKSLEIEYKCVEVYPAEDQFCVANQSLLVTASTGYLANIVTEETGQGSQSCPWRFQPQPGQTVYLTLLDFGVWNDTADRDRRSMCRIYATIKEIETTHQKSDRPTFVCGGEERVKFIMSTDAETTIEVMKKESGPTINDSAYFFIKYQVFNCKKLNVPHGAIADVSADGIRFYCSFNREVVWDVMCIAGEWTPKHNISCIDRTALTTLSTDGIGLNQSTHSSPACPELYASHGVSMERTNSGYRASCFDGDYVELFCIDGTWVPSKPSRCVVFSTKVATERPSDPMNVAVLVLPAVALIALVITVTFTCIICRRRRS